MGSEQCRIRNAPLSPGANSRIILGDQSAPAGRRVTLDSDQIALCKASMLNGMQSARIKHELHGTMSKKEFDDIVFLTREIIIGLNEGKITDHDAQIIIGALESTRRQIRKTVVKKFMPQGQIQQTLLMIAHTMQQLEPAKHRITL